MWVGVVKCQIYVTWLLRHKQGNNKIGKKTFFRHFFIPIILVTTRTSPKKEFFKLNEDEKKMVKNF